MLLLMLKAGDARYGVPASRILEVIPVPVLRPLARTPGFVCGVFSYHGTVVPVIDLTALITGQPARLLLSTRILLINFQPLQAPGPVLFGLLAEHATETVTCTREEFQPTGIQGSEAPYTGGILVRPYGLIQELDVDRVLTAVLQEQLFGTATASV